VVLVMKVEKKEHSKVAGRNVQEVLVFVIYRKSREPVLGLERELIWVFLAVFVSFHHRLGVFLL